MLPPRLALAALLLAPALSPAQTIDPTPAPAPASTPRFYMGLGVSSSQYQRFGSNYLSGMLVPVQLTAGYQLSPRLAVQVGLAYSGYSNRYDYVGRLYTDPSVPSTYFAAAGRNTTRRVSESVLGRYTLTRKAAHRLQFDVLGGFGLAHQLYRTRGTQTDSLQNTSTTTSYDNRRAYTFLLFSFGPSLRYRFGERVELVYDLLFDATILSNYPYPYRGITGGMALGLRYRFGPR